jgi:hypothetical protein
MKEVVLPSARLCVPGLMWGVCLFRCFLGLALFSDAFLGVVWYCSDTCLVLFCLRGFLQRACCVCWDVWLDYVDG